LVRASVPSAVLLALIAFGANYAVSSSVRAALFTFAVVVIAVFAVNERRRKHPRSSREEGQ
jgi:hypothetical protein